MAGGAVSRVAHADLVSRSTTGRKWHLGLDDFESHISTPRINQRFPIQRLFSDVWISPIFLIQALLWRSEAGNVSVAVCASAWVA